MAALVLSLHEIKEEDEKLGKKIKDLIKLVNYGFDVSESFIVTGEAFIDFVNKNNLGKKVEHLLSSGASSQIDKHIDQAKLSDNLIREILREYKKFGTVLDDVEAIVNGEKVKGETSLIEKIRQIFVSNFKNNTNDPSLVVQKVHFGKHGKVRTSSKFVNTIHSLLPAEILIIENMLSKFKTLFYIPHEIDFTLEKNKVLINKISPETHVALKSTFVQETDYKIIKNSSI